PENLPPVIAHTAWPGGVVLAKIINPQVNTFQLVQCRIARPVRKDIPFCGGQIHRTVRRIHQQRAADHPVVITHYATFAAPAGQADIADLTSMDIEMIEVTQGPGGTVDVTTLPIQC